MPSIRNVLLTGFLAVAAASAIPQADTASTTAVAAASTTPTASPTPIIDATAPLKKPSDETDAEDDLSNSGGSYYPSTGTSYDDDPSAAVDETMSDPEGESTAFMSMNTGAQIGIIVAVVVGAIAMFSAVVAYYIHRRKAWKTEVARRSRVLVAKKSEQTKPAEAADSADSLEKGVVERGTTVTTVQSTFDRSSEPVKGWKGLFTRK